MWETLPAGQFRHADHRFEWIREEFQAWAERVGERHGDSVHLSLSGRWTTGWGRQRRWGFLRGATVRMAARYGFDAMLESAPPRKAGGAGEGAACRS